MFSLSNANQSISFKPIKMFVAGGEHKQFVILWLISLAIIVPSSLVTRYLEWTGIELSLGGVSFFLTVYLPMLVCIPFAYWFGFWWAAIPAYFSSFLVALVGGMPLEWAVLFSLANPLTLLFHFISLTVFIKQQQPSSLISIIGFVLTSLIATLAGSIGAFIWAWSNNVGFHAAIPVWQGWWVGGWLQAMFIVLPLLFILSPFVRKCVAPITSQEHIEPRANYRTMFTVALTFLLILIGYVFITRHIGIQQLQPLRLSSIEPEEVLMIDNAISSLSYPLYILLSVMVALTLIMYKAILFWSETIWKANTLLSEKNEELEKLATTDSLTGLLIRRKIMETAQFEFSRARRQQLPISILMLDIDKFKRVNDEFGHLIGDTVIKQVATRITNAVRSVDFVGRYGGEEFLVCLPGASQDEIDMVAHRILDSVQSEKVVHDKYALTVTVSIGLAKMNDSDLDVTQLIDAADQALLLAKSQGRNCIKCRD